jgi:hypothetical protein
MRAPLFCGLLALICGTYSASAHGLGTVGNRDAVGQKPAEMLSIRFDKSADGCGMLSDGFAFSVTTVNLPDQIVNIKTGFLADTGRTRNRGEEPALRTVVLDPAPVQGLRGLYDAVNPDNQYEHINGFASLTVLQGPAGDAFWTAGTAACLKAKLTAQNTYLINWNKPGGGCPWVGLGVGWDQWSGKNLGPIVDVAAVELVVRVPEGQPVKSFPWAFGLEDYSGRQAWMGMSADRILNGPVGPGYRAIRLPLTAFNWREMKTDPSNIKQFLLQFEADGVVEIHSIRIVRLTDPFDAPIAP